MSERKATIFDLARLKSFYGCALNTSECSKCPFSYNNNGYYACDAYICEFPDKANEAILKWVDEHPIKTRKSEFIKMFPNADFQALKESCSACYFEQDRCVLVDNGYCDKIRDREVENCDECWDKFWNEEVKQNDTK